MTPGTLYWHSINDIRLDFEESYRIRGAEPIHISVGFDAGEPLKCSSRIRRVEAMVPRALFDLGFVVDGDR